MPLPLPLPLTEEIFIQLMLKYDDINKAVLDKASLDNQTGIDWLGYYWWPFIEQPAWLSDYSANDVKKFALDIAEKMSLISKAHHALGIMDYFSKAERHDYAFCVKEAFSHSESYCNTFHNLYLSKEEYRESTFNSGFYNIPFQASLVDSVEKLITEQGGSLSEVELKVLNETLLSMQESLKYYQKYAAKNRFDLKEIASDLNKGEMRIFATGRRDEKNFHTFNFIIKGNKLIICDRYDVNENYSDPVSMGMFTHYEQIKTGRKAGQGAFVYELTKPFSQFSAGQKQQLIAWLTGEISQKESLVGINKLLGLGNPTATLTGKRQTKGNCRYASKKAAVCAALFASLMSEEGTLQEKKDIAEGLCKKFTAMDRLNKIDEIINALVLRDEEKEEMLLLVLLRNNDPSNASDIAIHKKIVGYLKESKGEEQTQALLKSTVEKVRAEIDKQFGESAPSDPPSPKKKAALGFLRNASALMLPNSDVEDKVAIDHRSGYNEG